MAAAGAWSAEPAAETATGAAKRPFPALFEVDYPLSRAKAWLNATANGARNMPEALKEQLPVKGNIAAQAAFAALNQKVSVTPEMSLDSEIKAYLEPIDDKTAELPELEAFIFQIAFILEQMEIVGRMEAQWPKDLREAEAKIPFLEKNASDLNVLWSVRDKFSKKTELPGLEILEKLPRSPLFTALKAEKQCDFNLFQTALKSAGDAEKLIARIKGENAGERAVVDRMKKFLLAKNELTRAKAQQNLGQNALAEISCSSGVELLENEFPQAPLLIELLFMRGDIRKEKKDCAGMCEDYRKACGAGDCSKFTRARVLGLCAAS